MSNHQVLKRKAVSFDAFLSYRVHKQTDKQTDNEFYVRRSTGLANRSANYCTPARTIGAVLIKLVQNSLLEHG